jgi:hypothetical protein
MKPSPLEKQWQDLMTLCKKEAELQEAANHPKLLKLVSREIDDLARQLGFSERKIVTREFRAERDGERIVRLVTE